VKQSSAALLRDQALAAIRGVHKSQTKSEPAKINQPATTSSEPTPAAKGSTPDASHIKNLIQQEQDKLKSLEKPSVLPSPKAENPSTPKVEAAPTFKLVVPMCKQNL